MLESGIQALVIANAAVAALIGTQFYPVTPPEDVTGTFATYQVISDVPPYLLSGFPAGVNPMRLQIDTWSGGTSTATYGAAKAAQAAIRKLLAGTPKTLTSAGSPCFSGALPGGTLVAGILVINAMDGFEQDSRSYRCTTDFLVLYYAGT
jgi:hypothetical protein